MFALQQSHTFMRIDPFAEISRQPVFRGEILLQLYTFIITIGIFLPIKYYLPPVLFIYVLTNWLTYRYAKESDLCEFESYMNVFLNVVVSTTCACIVHLVVDEAYKLDSGARLLDVMKD